MCSATVSCVVCLNGTTIFAHQTGCPPARQWPNKPIVSRFELNSVHNVSNRSPLLSHCARHFQSYEFVSNFKQDVEPYRSFFFLFLFLFFLLSFSTEYYLKIMWQTMNMRKIEKATDLTAYQCFLFTHQL